MSFTQPCGDEASNPKQCHVNETCCYRCENIKECYQNWLSDNHKCSKYPNVLGRWCSSVKEKIEKNGFFVPISKPRKIKAKFIGERIEQF